MANLQRGEVSIVMCGKTYTLRPTFEALCEIEERLDTSILQLVGRFEEGDVRQKTIATVIWAGIFGYTGDVDHASVSDIGELVIETGLIPLISQKQKDGSSSLAMFLAQGMMGGRTEAEIDKASKKKTTQKQEK